MALAVATAVDCGDDGNSGSRVEFDGLDVGRGGKMVAMGNDFLCAYFCVHGETTKNKEESKIMNRTYLEQ